MAPAVKSMSIELRDDKLWTVFRYFPGCGQPTLIPEAIHNYIDGTFRLELVAPFRPKHVSIVLEGVSTAKVPVTKHGRRKVASQTCSTVRAEKILWQQSTALPAGTHVYAFHIAIPNFVPPSFRGHYGSVSYTLTATVIPRGPFAKPMKVFRPVYVRRCLLHPPELPVTMKHTGTMGNGTLRYGLEIPKFTPTDGQLKAVVKIQRIHGNKSKVTRVEYGVKEISQYRAHVKKRVTIFSNDVRCSTYVDKRLSMPRASVSLSNLDLDSEVPFPITLRIPATTIQPDFSCRTIDVRHVLRLKFHVEEIPFGNGLSDHSKEPVRSMYRVEIPIIGFSPPPDPQFHYAPWIVSSNLTLQRLKKEMQLMEGEPLPELSPNDIPSYNSVSSPSLRQLAVSQSDVKFSNSKEKKGTETNDAQTRLRPRQRPTLTLSPEYQSVMEDEKDRFFLPIPLISPVDSSAPEPAEGADTDDVKARYPSVDSGVQCMLSHRLLGLEAEGYGAADALANLVGVASTSSSSKGRRTISSLSSPSIYQKTPAESGGQNKEQTLRSRMSSTTSTISSVA